MKVNKKGQITNPKALRDEFQLKPGDKVKLFIDGNEIRAIPCTGDITDLKGLFPRRDKPPATLEEMEEGIIEGALESMKK